MPQIEEGQTEPMRVCEMRQELRQAQSNQRVLTVALQPADDEGANITLVAPFGLLLSEGISISVADNDLLSVPFRTCLPGGCIGQAQVSQSVIAQLVAGDEARVSMVTNAEQPLAVTVSLIGFTAAWNRLLELRG